MRTHAELPAVVFLGLTFLGWVLSPDWRESLVVLFLHLLGIGLLWGLSRSLAAWPRARWGVLLLSLGGLGLALIALVATDWDKVRLISLPVYDHFPRHIVDLADGELFNPRIVGMALATMIPVSLGQAVSDSVPWIRGLAGMATLVMSIVFLLTQSIQGVLGVAAGLILLMLWRTRWALLAVLPGLALVLGVVRFFGIRDLAVALLSQSHPLGIAVVLRLDIWSRAIAILGDMPYTGAGLNSFSVLQTHFYPGLLLGPTGHAHNLYLQVALDLGLPGLACFLWLIGCVVQEVREARRCQPRSEQGYLLAGCFAGLGSFLASGLVDTIWTAKPVVLFWIILGIQAALCRLILDEGAGDQVKRSVRVQWLLIPILIGALVLISIIAFPGRWTTDLGLIQAHRGVLLARSGGDIPEAMLRSAAARIEAGLQQGQGTATVWRTLGSVYAWLGEEERALECLNQAVQMDIQNPLGRYAPFELWRQNLLHRERRQPWEDLLWVYQYWMNRYPQRAEGYAQVALVWSQYGGNLKKAMAVLDTGLERQAQPGALLLAIRETLSVGTISATSSTRPRSTTLQPQRLGKQAAWYPKPAGLGSANASLCSGAGFRDDDAFIDQRAHKKR